MNPEEIQQQVEDRNSDKEELLKALLAHEQIRKYLFGQLTVQTGTKAPAITWTGPKAALIELIYALHSTGVFNEGSVDIKTIATAFEACFKVSLGNYYRVIQDIKLRKTGQVQFLKQLKDNLEKRLNDLNV